MVPKYVAEVVIAICAVGHDFGHQGLINQFPFQIEVYSAMLIKQYIVDLPSKTKFAFSNRMKILKFFSTNSNQLS